MKIPFLYLKEHNLSFKNKYQEAFERFLNSGDYILGKEVEKFEHSFANFIGTKYATGVSNCLDALELLLKSVDIKEGDEVIVPSNTYIATWLAIINVGATPIPVEPDIKTFNINPNLIENSITTKTKAIIVVHLYGLPCEMDEINKIAKRYSLFVFEDSAQSHGSKYKGKMAGSLSDAGAFSFYPSKNIGALGDAGIITTNSNEICSRTKLLRNYGSSIKYVNQEIGKNSRLDELQASFLNIRYKSINQENNQRTKLANIYLERLSNENIPIRLPTYDNKLYTHSWHLFVILSKDRDKLKSYLSSLNISTMMHYPIPPHKQKAFSESPISKINLPISEEIHKSCLSLPISSLHSIEEIKYICDALIRYYK